MQKAAVPDIDVSVLGRIEVRRGGELIDLGTPRQRTIMAALALAENRPVTFDAIVDRVWGAAAPPTAVGTMQRYVATLRQAIEPDRAPDQGPAVLVTEGTAYALLVRGGHRDVDRFQDAVAQARRLLACIPDPLRPVAPRDQAAEIAASVHLLDDALELWRGEPYADLGDHDGQVAAERARLHDLRDGAQELRLVGLLALGRHAEIIGDLESITSLHPLHERWWALRSVALIRCGRQAEALEGLSTMRSLLADELGVDPSPPLQDLYADILRQATSLAWTAAPSAQAHRVNQSRPPRPRWTLVGRDAESGTLTELLDQSRTHSRSAFVTGEAGAGKTRLIHELMQTAHDRGVTVASGRCSASAPALWPVRTVLEALGTGAEVTEALGPQALAVADFDTWQRVAEALRRAVRAGPVLVVVEDVQRADTATLHLLEHLVADHDLGAVTLVMSRRTKDGDDPRLSRLAAAVARSTGLRIDLGPLPDVDGRQLALSVNADLGDPDAITRRAGGNPFFIAALALDNGTVTGGLSDVVRARVGDLEPEVRAALELASAADGPVDPETIATLAGCARDDAETALDAALRAGLLSGDGPHPTCYTFEHEVVREVLRTDLPVRTRMLCRQRTERLSPTTHRSATTQSGRDSRRAAHSEAADHWSTIAELMRSTAPVEETRAS
ncbi:AAA family ATPase [Nocardioides sp. cx-169]|uniref:BTAD domain-containing putative transcriptional regulator n=1 Tax=Nocardioides sp. cx-169 TaxID=2899080 RepID=UPI001E3BB306|nr:BTAD domain-containing putative transcriptional regulator [Nocardioides sp. cx-169]MCD4536133.1 AAA family ATPase [Nocardioides sp. cx-169]